MPADPFHPSQVSERSASWPIALVCGIVSAIFLAIVWLHWPWLEQAVAVEEAPVAWLQSSMLWSGATLALLLVFVEPARRRGWGVLALALLLAALDERFMGHERLKDWMLFRFFSGELAAMGRVGDLPMLLYAAAGLAFVTWLARGGPRFAGIRWLVAAVVVGTAGIALDIATKDLGMQVVEEGCELLAETLFVCGLLRHAQVLLSRR